ncbi:preprotein translocase subunit SecB [Geoalkalibacter ferrihydriticus]|uniref:Preprotein translocase subunit SecB n=2 Tax=Geoalkalibacter ferrihydriticus TaxID=392333 RepID=A0A0C2DS31_9BACT|nr:protein-export chaperone SecB [Geoalkalibacter ferrihydriticus]KIH76259.1 hypothetical protein GFER_11620 [Geoalkalibacter ferrihydriticus DSM 17813]SDL24032.1 preprotein translocase subunit SecB [Geoalkalibacter ferrihydriticus]
MAEKKEGVPLTKYHPIQVQGVLVKELFISANGPPSEDKGVEGGRFSLMVGHSEYDEEDKEISVSLKLEVGFEEDEKENSAPFSMRIEIVGNFKVDESEFPVEHIDHWAQRNAPLILFPYLREHAYSLTARCGFKPMLLPLLEVPTFKPPE